MMTVKVDEQLVLPLIASKALDVLWNSVKLLHSRFTNYTIDKSKTTDSPLGF